MNKSLSSTGHFSVGTEQYASSSSDLQSLILDKEQKSQPLLDKLVHEQGHVIGLADEGKFIVRLAQKDFIFDAHKAFSCLVEPEINDLVLVSGDSSDYYILSILQRDAQDLKIKVAGKLKVVSQSAEITASSSIALNASSAHIKTNQWQQSAYHYEISSYESKHSSSTFKYVGQTAEMQLQNYYLLAADAQRYVTGTDRVNALTIDYSADFISKLSAQTTLINGTEILKTDAKKILMG